MQLYAIPGGQQDEFEPITSTSIDIHNDVSVTEFMDHLLSHACPSIEPDVDGFSRYFIETHCVGWWITARREKNGEWTVKKMESELT